MWQLYSYEISTTDRAGNWLTELNDYAMFSRNPEESARALLEQWINSHHGQLPGGRVFTYGSNTSGRQHDPEQSIIASVRVLVWNGDPTGEPAAAAYLGHPAERPARRSRFSLRRHIPRPRRTDAESATEVTESIDDDGTGDHLVRAH